MVKHLDSSLLQACGDDLVSCLFLGIRLYVESSAGLIQKVSRRPNFLKQQCADSDLTEHPSLRIAKKSST
jgi:hypothetical protein